MCGITGFYSINSQRSKTEERVIGKKMADALTHRGPDHGDIWQDPDLALLLAHRRLSILDLSAEGHQPMTSHSDRYCLIYNGEIYNHLDLRAELEGAYSFQGRSDTETLLAAIEHWGLNRTLQKLTGMFAFALYDQKERTLHFTRDRLGKKPLYIGWAGKGKKSTLVFASELKALCTHPDFKPELDDQALGQYLHFGFIPAPASIYKNIWKLPPANRLSLDLTTLKTGINLSADMKPYWNASEQYSLAAANQTRESETAIIDEFEQRLNQAVRIRTLSDVPLGTFLSGGIDSSTVTALLQKSSPAPIKTYSIGFHEDGYDEAAAAKKIANHLGTDHHEHYCKPSDALDLIPQLPEIYDEPFADQSAIPTLLVSRFAKQDVTVALSGDGGDELLGGYTRHIATNGTLKKLRLLPSPLRNLLSAILTSLPPEKWQALKPNRPLFGQHIHKTARLLSSRSDDELYLTLLSHWHKIPVETRGEKPSLHTIRAATLAEKIILWDVLTYLPGDVLTKVDRASMAYSLEVRSPLLDHNLFEYAWNIPMSMKIRNGKGKYILRQILKKHVPEELFERPKQGFNMPIDTWLQTDLKDWAEDLLDENALKEQNLLDARIIRKTWDAHIKGKTQNTNALWNVLMFQAWHKHWMKK